MILEAAWISPTKLSFCSEFSHGSETARAGPIEPPGVGKITAE